MAFSATSEVENGIARITVTGELDASVAGDFRTQIEKVAAEKPRRLVLMMSGLEYMSSAGVRVLIFAKQKLQGLGPIYIVGARQPIIELLEEVGLQHSVDFLPEYDVARIEG